MKQVIISLIFIMAATAAQTQVNPDLNASQKKRDITKPWFSMHAGINYSGVEGETDFYNKYINGFTAGFRFSFLKITERFRINVEVSYSEQGGKYSIENDDLPPGLPPSGKLRLYYANLPVTFRLQGDKGFYVELGAQAGYLLKAENKYNGRNTDVRDQLNEVDYDLVGGIGLRITKYIGIGVRAIPGVRTINERLPNVEYNSDRNMVFTALVSYYW